MTRGDRLSADLPDFVRELQLHDVAHPDEIVDMQLVSGPTNLTLYIYIYIRVYIYIYIREYIFLKYVQGYITVTDILLG